MKTKNLIIIVVVSVAILLIPLIAMQFTSEVNWKVSDFVVAGILLIGTGVMCELLIAKLKVDRYRPVIYITFLLLLFLIWAELAVGIFGTPFAGN